MWRNRLLPGNAFDANERVMRSLATAGDTAVIASKANRKQLRTFDSDMRPTRHLIGNFFAELKQCHVIATCYDKIKRNCRQALDRVLDYPLRGFDRLRFKFMIELRAMDGE